MRGAIFARRKAGDKLGRLSWLLTPAIKPLGQSVSSKAVS